MKKLYITALLLSGLSCWSYSQAIESRTGSITSYFHNIREAERNANELRKEMKIESGTAQSSIFPLALNFSTENKQIDVRNSYAIPLNSQAAKKKVDIDLITGFSLGGKMDNSYATLLSTGNISGGFKVGGIIGFRLQQSSKVFEKDEQFMDLFRKYASENSDLKEEILEKKLVKVVAERLHNATYWVYFSPQWEGRKFLNSSAFESIEFAKQTNTLRSYSLGISSYQNQLAQLDIAGLFDLSLTFIEGDNFSALNESKVTRSFKGTQDGVDVINNESFTAFYGDYLPNISSKVFSFETYLVYKPLPLFAVFINPIYSFDHELYAPTWDFSYTIYFLDPKKSFLMPNVGLVFSHKDLSKTRDEVYTTERSRFSLGIVTRLNIGNWFD